MEDMVADRSEKMILDARAQRGLLHVSISDVAKGLDIGQLRFTEPPLKNFSLPRNSQRG